MLDDALPRDPDADLDPDTHRWRLDAAAVDRHGIRRADLLTSTRRLLEVLHREDDPPQSVSATHDPHRRNGFTARYVLRPPAGRARQFLLVGERNPDGSMSGVTIDITGILAGAADEAVHATLAGRAAIEQAKGALMMAHSISDQAAFVLLVKVSQHANLKLRTVAEHIVERMVDPGFQQLSPQETLRVVGEELLAAPGRSPDPTPDQVGA